ncbi:MAG: hypothetical protein HY290_06500 [Planctomycetia bacterium]|nr:hypothetical protein [Planctomycetia bacterium]
MVAGRQALVVHRRAEVADLRIGDHLPRVPAGGQELPHELVHADRFGTCDFNRAVLRFHDRDVGQKGSDVIRSRSLLTSFFPINPLPPMTTIFMVHLSGNGVGAQWRVLS